MISGEPQTIALEAGQTASLLFRNNKRGGIAILKQDAVSGKPLADAEFLITDMNNTPIGTYKTGLDGYIRISDLAAGYYFIQETKAPEGYLLDDTKHQIKVEDFQVTLVELKNHEKASLIINKTDAQSKLPLAGAQFGVYAMSGTLIKTITTDASGVASLNGLAPGWYRIRETKAPEGYVLSEEEHQVEVVKGKPITQ